MKFPQFRVRTLLLLTAIMGVVFVACAKWPVEAAVPTSTRVTKSGGTTYTVWQKITRPPTFSEWAIRASIASGILLAVFVLIGAWRARNAKTLARDHAHRPAG